MNRLTPLLILMLMLAVLVLPACAPTKPVTTAAQPVIEVPTETSVPDPAPVVEVTGAEEGQAQEPTATQAAETQPEEATPTQPEQPPVQTAPAKPPSGPVPAVDADFQPTSPSRVNLAAGYPQLVEFFAYW